MRQWSQRQLAEAAGVGIITVWRAENGKALRPAMLKAIALALGTTYEELAEEIKNWQSSTKEVEPQ